MTVLLTASLGVLLAAAPAPAPALIIVEVDSPSQMIGLAGQATRALQDAAKAMKRPVLTGEELRARLPAKDFTELVHCAGNTSCVQSALSSLGSQVGQVVTGQLGRDEKNYLLKLWLHDVPGLSVVTEVDRQILIASRRYTKDLNALVVPFLRGEKDLQGVLKLSSTVPGAEVFLNGELIGLTPLERKLTPAKYEVRVEKKKYLAVVRLIDVFPNKTTAEEIRMLLKPGEVADPDVALAKSKAPAPEAEGPGVRLSPGVWVAGGAAVAAGAVGLGFALKFRGEEKSLLGGYDPVAMTYQGTRALALQAQTDAIIADVAFAIAGAAAIVTAVLVVLDVTSTPPAVQVGPAVGSGAAGVVVGGSF